MSNLKKTHETIRQNGETVKKSQKHEANLQKNSTLYFQIGLIVCLLAAYGLLEMKFETTIPKLVEVIPSDGPIEISIENFKVYEEPLPKSEPEIQKKTVLIDKIKEVDNDYEIKKALEIITSDQNTSPDAPIDPSQVSVIDMPDDETNVPYNFIQNVPIYPGCEKAKGNDERKKCMSEKITKLIQRKFNSDIASDYGLSGRQKIDVQFTIDKTGHVNNIKTRAPHPKLQDEAVRVINMLPEMTPGKQNDKNVGVIYTLPIVFQVQ
ncbi:protein TonB [Flaviramulus basaltis]|uniref:Protein TonB n=1 Tax=Flaviramulus basaltis TaxID=369401 RepID=A0A1K2IEC6_9FLAO|nr:energy transducer TonB [Flaviramulus basaltis]SFZ90781.1 protein TonB [Flaviramulus basaltis]